ncbi:MAG TPA: hypothetical protein VHM30_11830 [Gemmatimonadaceae bacterium]|nr:hypothetical protein [Gemmatimonadaceae bacterium]
MVAILGVAATVAAISIRAPVAVGAARAAAELIGARERAVRTGKPVTVIVADGGAIRAVTAHPDGRVIAEDGSAAVDIRSGRPVDAR